MNVSSSSSTFVQPFPPPPQTGGIAFMFMFPYALFLFIGTIGNVSVLTYVYYITRSLKWSVMTLGNTLVYVVVLSFVDLLVSLSIPFHLTQTILQYWLFGSVFCKLYWVLEIASKMCSTFILCALAFDRFMAICHPEVKRVHSVRQTAAISFFTAILSLVLIMPIVASAKVLHRRTDYYFITPDGVMHGVESLHCTDGMQREQRSWLMALLSLVAFLLPTAAIVYFYVKITLRLRLQMTSHIQSRIPYRRITLYTLVITSFYLFCQIPFWATQIYETISNSLGWNTSGYTETQIYLMYSLHLLPYFSASFNWLIYALLNSQFKKGFVLVTERMLRKQTRSMLPTGRDVWDGNITVDVASRCDDVVALCPNCEHPLTLRLKPSQYSATA